MDDSYFKYKALYYVPTSEIINKNLEIVPSYDSLRSVEVFPKITTKDINDVQSEQFYQDIPTSSNTYNTIVTKNMSFQDLIKSQNLPIKITSGYRAGAHTSSGNTSNHSKKDAQGNPMAYDIQPYFNGKVHKNPEAFQYLYNTMANNPIVKQWFKERGYGILNETTSAAMKKYGSTGPHFHIGPDKAAIKFSKNGIKLIKRKK